MAGFINDVSRHWGLSISTAILSGGVAWAAFVFLAKKWVGKAVDSRFDRGLKNHQHDLDKVLEDHKQRLNVLTEAERFNFQRKVTDFTLYTNKRHTIYPELYKILLSAYKAILGQIHGLGSTLVTLDYEIDELQRFLEDEGFPPAIRRDILRDWNQDRQHTLGIINRSKTAISLYQYRDFILLNELFITEELAEKAWALFRILNQMYIRSRNNNLDQEDKISDLEKTAKDEVDSIKAMMRSELSIADYEK